MSEWLTIFTKPRMERQVNDFLESRGANTFLPMVHEYSTHLRRKEPQPFFPCYLFVQIDLTSPEYAWLSWIPGLRSVVRFGGQPALIGDDIIAEMRRRVSSLQGSEYFDDCGFRPGDRVRIEGGALEGLEAMFDRRVSRAGRARILLKFLGQLTCCEVNLGCLSKAG